MIDPRFEGVKILVFQEASMQDFVPQNSSSCGEVDFLQIEYIGMMVIQSYGHSKAGLGCEELN